MKYPCNHKWHVILGPEIDNKKQCIFQIFLDEAQKLDRLSIERTI